MSISLITNPLNVRYLTGFTGSSGAVLTGDGLGFLITDFRYQAQASQESPDWEIVIARRGLLLRAAKLVRRNGAGEVAFDANSFTVSQYRDFERSLPGVKLKATRNLIEKRRVIKTERELELIRRAAEITDQALLHALSFLQPGLTERRVALRIDDFLARHGAEGPAFETMVAAGARSAMPHARSTGNRLKKGDLVFLDFGARVEGYCADLTRTVCIGKPTREQQRIYSLVRSAQSEAEDRLCAGMLGREADAISRRIIERAGHGDHFGHGLGHGVGLAVHEAPRLSRLSRDRLKPNMLTTVEPGVYVPGWGGVRIEDLVLVEEKRCEILTRSPRPARCLSV